jgi:transposase
MLEERDVIRIESETDIERLRQVALLQRAELDRLYARLTELTTALARARGEDTITALQLELTAIQEQLAARTRALFGPSSEKRPRAGDRARDAARPPRTGHGPRAQLELPRVEVVHTLDEPDRTCPQCGGGLREMTGQYEEAEEIDVVERAFRLVRHQRQKYTCRCGACIDTALGPPKLIPSGRYSVDFAVAVAVAKYGDHMPLARQVRQMARLGLATDTQTLWDQLHALYRHLVPTAEALHALVLASPVIAADETRWPLLGAPGASKWHAWSVTSPAAISYRILSSRSAAAAGEVLGDYRGIAVVDGYSAYKALRDERAQIDGPPPVTLAFCWTHARRKFVDAEPHYPQATELIARIADLYEIEARADEAEPGERLAVRARLRDTESRAVVAGIKAWLTAQVVLPRSSLGEAIGYTLRHWDGLERFLDDPRIPLDTNAVERGLRAVAIGRKNHYGSRSERGTRVAALFYTLMESAKLAGVEPARYLAEATRRAIANPGAVTLPKDLAGG